MNKNLFFILLLPVVSLFSSCQKDEDALYTLWESLGGYWYIDGTQSWTQYKYSNEYKQFCNNLDTNTINWQLKEQREDCQVRYGYWKLQSQGEYHYEYFNGKIRGKSNQTCYLKDDNTLKFGDTKWHINSLNNKYLEVEYRDTTLFLDNDNIQKIAWIYIDRLTFSRDEIINERQSYN